MRELIGYYEYRVSLKSRLLLVNLSLEYGMNLWRLRESGEEVIFRFPAWRAGTLESLMQQKGISYEKGCLSGVAGVCRSVSKHPGLVLGLLFSLLLYLWVGGTVWEVRILSQTDIDEDRVLAYLAESGLKEGTPIWRIDPDRVVSDYLLLDEEVAFATLHLNGVVAEVELIALEEKKDIENTAPPCNIVADKAALITDMTVYSGIPAVRVGQTVGKGDLLVSGVTTDVGGTRILSAQADVIGQVQETLTYEVSKTREVYQVRARGAVGVSLSAFGLNLSFGRQEGDLVSTRQMYLFGLVRLPVRYTVYRRVEEVATTCTWSDAEAQRVAEAALEEQLRALVGEGALIDRNVKAEPQENSFLLTWEVTYEGNIGKALAFEVENR